MPFEAGAGEAERLPLNRIPEQTSQGLGTSVLWQVETGHRRCAVEFAPYLIALALTLLFYSPFFFMPNTQLSGGDRDELYVLNRAYTARRFHEGSLPEWTHAVLSGYPFLSEPQKGIFYPGNLLVSLLCRAPERGRIMDYFVLAHIALLALGGVFLARNLGLGAAGSVAVSLIVTHNGFVVMHLGHMSVTQIASVGIWGIGFLARAVARHSSRSAAMAGMCMASVALIGHPQMGLFVYAAGFGGAMLLALERAWATKSWPSLRRSSVLMIAALCIAVAGAMVQLLPTRKFLSVSSRYYGETTLEIATAASLPPGQSPGLWFPNLYHPILWRLKPHERALTIPHCWGVPDMPGEYMHYIGLVSFALGLAGWMMNLRRPLAHALFWGGVLMWIVALGRYAGVYGLLYKHLPGFASTRIPARLLWLAFLAWAILAGMAVDAVARGLRSSNRKLGCRAGAACAAGIALGGTAALLLARLACGSWASAFENLVSFVPHAQLTQIRPLELFQGDVLHQTGFAALTCFLAAIWFLRAGRSALPAPKLAWAAVVLVFLELGVYGFRRNICQKRDLSSTQNTMFAALPKGPRGRVLLGPFWPADLENYALLSGDDNARGYEGIVLKSAKPFLPSSSFADQNPVQEKIRDIHNVTHLVYERKRLDLTAGGHAIRFPDMGWASLSADSEKGFGSLRWDIETTSQVHCVHLVSAAEFALQQPDGVVLARLELLDAGDRALASFPIRLGYETSEWSHDNPAHPVRPGHRKAPTAFVRPIHPGSFPQGEFFLSSHDIPSSVSALVRSIRVAAACGPPPVLAVAQVVLESDAGARVLHGVEALGYREAVSKRPRWLVLERSGALGYAWMVPRAEPVSYEQNFGRVITKFSSPAFDPSGIVLVNEAHLDSASAQLVNAPDPAKFSGRVTEFSRKRPERIKARTESTQPGWLVISNTWYPGWRAWVDGKRTKLCQADGSLMAIHVPAGSHNIKLEYRTPRFRTGAAVSSVSWAVALLAAGLPRRRRRD